MNEGYFIIAILKLAAMCYLGLLIAWVLYKEVIQRNAELREWREHDGRTDNESI